MTQPRIGRGPWEIPHPAAAHKPTVALAAVLSKRRAPPPAKHGHRSLARRAYQLVRTDTACRQYPGWRQICARAAKATFDAGPPGEKRPRSGVPLAPRVQRLQNGHQRLALVGQVVLVARRMSLVEAGGD